MHSQIGMKKSQKENAGMAQENGFG